MAKHPIVPLTFEEVVACVERKNNAKIPALLCRWWGNGLRERYGAQLDALDDKYPEDIYQAWFRAPGSAVSSNDNPSYRFGYLADYSGEERHSIGESVVLLKDWADLPAFLADFPNPDEPGVMDEVERQMYKANGRYKLGGFWRLFHEKLWEIRGMENLMLDYYDNMDGLKIIGRKLLDFHKRIAERYKELGFNGIFTSDDLGHQTSSMMSPAIFKELYFPLYKEFIGHVHALGMHVWLHSCGNNTLLMDDLIRAGLDVFHPVQKHCMDEKAVAEKYGKDITFLYGIDVQDLLPNGTPEEIQTEIESMAELFRQNGGSLIFAAGNGIMPDTPIENIRVMLETVYGFR